MTPTGGQFAAFLIPTGGENTPQGFSMSLENGFF
jgi:hypothetical protein